MKTYAEDRLVGDVDDSALLTTKPLFRPVSPGAFMSLQANGRRALRSPLEGPLRIYCGIGKAVFLTI